MPLKFKKTSSKSEKLLKINPIIAVIWWWGGGVVNSILSPTVYNKLIIINSPKLSTLSFPPVLFQILQLRFEFLGVKLCLFIESNISSPEKKSLLQIQCPFLRTIRKFQEYQGLTN